MGTIRIETLVPDGPIIAAAAERIADRHRRAGKVDLDRVVVVVPAASAGRRLLQRLIVLCADRQEELRPPRIVTVGGLPELLYPSRRPFADDILQLFVWSAVLREMPVEKLHDLLAAPPRDDDAEGRLDLAASLQTVHRELAGETLSMRNVAERSEVHASEGDRRRWARMAEIQEDYLARLDRLGFWDRQTARRYAIDHGECATDRELILVAAVDLSRSIRRMLEQVAANVTVLRISLAEDADRFDELGCLIESRWARRPLSLSDVTTETVDSPDDQATAAIEFVAEFARSVPRESLSIGMPDEGLWPYLQRRAESCDLPISSAGGTPVRRLPAFRFLESLLDWLATRSFRSLASLVRHPLVYERLCRSLGHTAWLGELDRHQRRHLPASVDTQIGGPDETRVVRAVATLDEWCRELTAGGTKPIGAWCSAWLDTLAEFLGERPLDKDDPADRGTLAVLQSLRDVWRAIEALPEELQPRVDAVRAQRWVLGRIAGERVPPIPDPRALGLEGWLELPWDDATHSIVLSFNEGCVPTAEPDDPLLPNPLRRKLGIMHSGRRYARDAYYLTLLVASRRRLSLVAGRRSATGDPLIPARLWFADEPEAIATRALQVFDRPPLAYLTPEASYESTSPELRGRLPLPDSRRRPEVLTPTDFRSYLACPYRFYLSRICRLSLSDDRADELDGGEFGDLMHDVLKRFGSGDRKHSKDPAQIRERLDALLTDEVSRRFAPRHLPAVDLQVEQLRLRLHDFADHQAAWVEQGWKIESIERTFDGKQLVSGAFEIPVRGRIDRIDLHRDGERRVLLDYKSGDRGASPDEAHRKAGEWVDLQLPMYRWLVADDQAPASAWQLGFIVLGKDRTKNGFKLAEWEPSVLHGAIERAKEIAGRIWKGIYWPPAEVKREEFDDFARILSLPTHDVTPDETTMDEATT